MITFDYHYLRCLLFFYVGSPQIFDTTFARSRIALITLLKRIHFAVIKSTLSAGSFEKLDTFESEFAVFSVLQFLENFVRFEEFKYQFLANDLSVCPSCTLVCPNAAFYSTKTLTS